jgi:UDP:flavonoid glycosyltransferase YjiC (YdhE family)
VGSQKAKLNHLETKDILIEDYAPYHLLYPKASLVVNHGGIGSIAEGLRAAKPLLMVPFAQDQFDNARRIQNLGLGLKLDAHTYSAARFIDALERLSSSSPKQHKNLAKLIAHETSQAKAVRVMECVLKL